MVRTTNRSSEAMPAEWLRKKVFQPWDGGWRRRTMYRPTADSATSMPSINNSPWIRGAPHNGFARLIRRTSFRISVSIRGRPPTRRDFQRQ
jgi:hypothetical protein